MTDGLSAGDILAMTKNNDNNDWMNNPFIYLVWMWMFGANGFGANAATQNAITRSDLFEGFNNQDVNGQLRGLTNGLSDGFYAMNTAIRDGFYTTQSEIGSANNATLSAIAGVAGALKDLSSEGYRNTCEITSAIHSEGEATRALITANSMQELRDRLADKDRDLLAANFQLSQQAQNATLIGALRGGCCNT